MLRVYIYIYIAPRGIDHSRNIDIDIEIDLPDAICSIIYAKATCIVHRQVRSVGARVSGI